MASGTIALSEKTRHKVRIAKGRWKGDPVTISCEWDGLLVVKHDPGLGAKRIVLVHPLACGLHVAIGEQPEELTLQVERKYTPEELEAKSIRHGTPTRVNERRSVVMTVALESGKKCKKALAQLQSCMEKAIEVFLRPPQVDQCDAPASAANQPLE
jgi:hypothetical protein